MNSLGGSKKILLFKDDFSHFRKMYFLKRKTEVCEYIEKYIFWSEKQCGNSIKILRLDCGTEFLNRNVRMLLERNGIDHQRSVPYCPQQNGKI